MNFKLLINYDDKQRGKYACVYVHLVNVPRIRYLAVRSIVSLILCCLQGTSACYLSGYIFASKASINSFGLRCKSSGL